MNAESKAATTRPGDAAYERAAGLLEAAARPGVLKVLDTLSRRATRADGLDGREWGRCLDAGLVSGMVPARLTPLGVEVWEAVRGLVEPRPAKAPATLFSKPELGSLIVRRLHAINPYLIAIVLVIAASRLATGGTAQPLMFAQVGPAEHDAGNAIVGYAALLAAISPVITAIFVGIEKCIRAWRAPRPEAEDAAEHDEPAPPAPPPRAG